MGGDKDHGRGELRSLSLGWLFHWTKTSPIDRACKPNDREQAASQVHRLRGVKVSPFAFYRPCRECAILKIAVMASKLGKPVSSLEVCRRPSEVGARRTNERSPSRVASRSQQCCSLWSAIDQVGTSASIKSGGTSICFLKKSKQVFFLCAAGEMYRR